jgi:hypothetical protein
MPCVQEVFSEDQAVPLVQVQRAVQLEAAWVYSGCISRKYRFEVPLATTAGRLQAEHSLK